VGESAEFKNGLVVTLEEASLMQVPVSLREKLGADDRLVAVRFSVENANPEDQASPRSFNRAVASPGPERSPPGDALPLRDDFNRGGAAEPEPRLPLPGLARPVEARSKAARDHPLRGPAIHEEDAGKVHASGHGSATRRRVGAWHRLGASPSALSFRR
jgi:hypothetical protein